MYHSWFQYNITKPYPFRWFTPLVIVGGIILTGLFTFLTVATNGYVLQPFSTNQPNVTLSQQFWFTKAPFAWRGSLRPTCQVHEIPIGSQFFTSNFGFLYQLTSVAKINASTRQSMATWPTLPYLNQVLHDCRVVDVLVAFHKRNNARDFTRAWWSWDGYARSRANCTVSTVEGDFLATYTTTYNVPNRDFSYVIQNDNNANASMWWATRLMNLYWFSSLVALAGVRTQGDPDSPALVMHAEMLYTTNQTEDVRSYNLFSLDYYFLLSDTSIINDVQQPLTRMYNNDTRFQSEILTQSLYFARIMYSAILIDLGQANSSNLLLDPTQLQFALNHPDDSFRNDPQNTLNCTDIDCDNEYQRFNTLAGPENTGNLFGDAKDGPQFERVGILEAFEKYKPNETGPGSLGTRNSTIFTQYSCSVPVRKAAGSIFFTVVVAVLVYLRAAWALLSSIAKSIVERKDPVGAHVCSGCGRIDKGSSGRNISGDGDAIALISGMGGGGDDDNSQPSRGRGILSQHPLYQTNQTRHRYSKLDDDGNDIGDSGANSYTTSIPLEPVTSYQGYIGGNASRHTPEIEPHIR